MRRSPGWGQRQHGWNALAPAPNFELMHYGRSPTRSWFTFNDTESASLAVPGRDPLRRRDHRSFNPTISAVVDQRADGKAPNVVFQIGIVPADGIRLPLLLEAGTSERRRFLGST
jgi:hypothetical protein